MKLTSILTNRRRQRRRAILVKDVRRAGQEFEKATRAAVKDVRDVLASPAPVPEESCRPVTPDELIKEILS